MTTAPPAPDHTGAFRDDKPKRGLAWLWWLLLLLAALIIAGIIIALVHHNSHHHKSTVSTVSSPSAAASSPAPGEPSSPDTSVVPGSGDAASGGAALVGGGGTAPVPLSGAQAKPSGAGIVLFPSASAVIDSNGQQVIAAAAKRIQAAHATSAIVVGYTDVVAGQVVNDPLSQERADNVAAALRTLVGSSVNITTSAQGEANPVAPNSTDAGRAQNRRAVIATS